MRAGVITGLAALVLVGGLLMGVAGLLLLPLVAGIALVGLVIWMLGRKAEHRPPIE